MPVDSPEHCLNSLMFSKADSASAEARIAGSGCPDAIVYLSVCTFGGSLGGPELSKEVPETADIAERPTGTKPL